MASETWVLVERERGRRKSCERWISKLEFAVKNALKIIGELEEEI